MNKTYLVNLIIFLSIFNFSFTQSNEEFTLCGDQKTYPYYRLFNPGLKYKGGFWEIKNHINRNYNVDQFKNLENNSGIVTIQFVVNCEGKVGRYQTQSCDLDYKNSLFNPLIIDRLLELTKELKDWIPAKDDNKITLNSHAFLSFRIEKGIITDILPQ